MPARRRTNIAVAVAVMAAAVATPCLAEPPDLDNGGFERGEVEVEANAWLRRAQSTVRPELELGLADGLGLELQLDLDHEPGDWTLDAVSAQLSRDLTASGSLGLAFEVGVQPTNGDLQAEVFAYATHETRAWTLDVNAGVEREDGAFAAVYAWRVVHPLRGGWGVGLEGGGTIPHSSGHDEHLVGPVVVWRPSDTAPEIVLGVSRENGGAYAARLGFAAAF